MAPVGRNFDFNLYDNGVTKETTLFTPVFNLIEHAAPPPPIGWLREVNNVRVNWISRTTCIRLLSHPRHSIISTKSIKLTLIYLLDKTWNFLRPLLSLKQYWAPLNPKRENIRAFRSHFWSRYGAVITTFRHLKILIWGQVILIICELISNVL